MGAAESVFSKQQLEEYQELTFFTKKEILHVHERFKALDPEAVQHNWNARLDKNKVMSLVELRVNPFADRICDVFSSSHDGNITFEDFLEMMSVFSEAAPINVKVDHAFRIYDLDGDDAISREDLMEVIRRLVGDNELTDEQMDRLVENVLTEADLDNDGVLSFNEFQHVMSKSPDFATSFRIRL